MAMKAKRYFVVIERERRARGPYRWSAYCPELSGCVSDGRTRAEALRNVREAVGGYLEARSQLPKPPISPEVLDVTV